MMLNLQEKDFSTNSTKLKQLGSFSLPRVPFVNCCQLMYLVISLLVLKADMGSDCISSWSLLIFLPFNKSYERLPILYLISFIFLSFFLHSFVSKIILTPISRNKVQDGLWLAYIVGIQMGTICALLVAETSATRYIGTRILWLLNLQI